MADQAKKNALGNAVEIIENFGGIRPMASKTGIAVTTIQGWKKRGNIPAKRANQIIQAARAHDINLPSLMKVDEGNDHQTSEKRQDVLPQKNDQHPQPQVAAKKETHKKETHKMTSSEHDELMRALKQNSEQSIKTTIWSITALLLVFLALGAFFIFPKAKRVEDNTDKIKQLESEVTGLDKNVEDVKGQTSFLQDMVPEKLRAKMDEVQNQAQNLQNTVTQLSEKAEEIQTTLFAAEAGSLSERLAKLEEQTIGANGSPEIAAVLARIRTLEQSLAGQGKLEDAVAELGGLVSNMDDKIGGLEGALAEVQSEGNSTLGQTLEGVPGQELKAAAMLVAFSQLRNSLGREAPFEEDLALLQNMMGEDNPELQAALTELAPKANGGVLTPEGLSDEFRGLAGDIAVSAIKGEDLSVMDKAKARLGQVLSVEKDGVPLTGTPNQKAVSEAQALLDKGDVKGALAVLKTLDGEAAKTAKPFMEQAEMTLLSAKVQEMLGQMISQNLSQIGGGIGGALTQGDGKAPLVSENENSTNHPQGFIDLEQIKKSIEEAIPTQDNVIKDEESGLTILPKQQKFKGFSTE